MKMCQKKVTFCILNFIFIAISLAFSDDNSQTIYNLARESENEGNIIKAIKYYEEYKVNIRDSKEIEKIDLKITRITPEYRNAVKRYERFLEKYPDSDFRFLARYELANLHKIKGNYDKALDEYRALSNLSKDTIYWQKTLINIAILEYRAGNYDFAKDELSKVMRKVDDYEDLGKVYYLLGKIMFAKGIYRAAEKYFLSCAGSYPQSSKGAASLLELIKTYILIGKYNEAERIAVMLNNLYPDSPEAYKSDALLDKIKNNNKEKKYLEIELINLNKEIEIDSKSSIILAEDLKNSINNNVDNALYSECGFYIQLGYLSLEENAKNMVNDFKRNNITDIYYVKTKASDTSKIFYRVVIGPFDTKSKANEKLIELKDKNIESIILELCKYYE